MHRLSIRHYAKLASIQTGSKARGGLSRQIMWLIAGASQSWKNQITDLLLSKIEFDTSFLRRLGIIFPTCTLEHQCQPICYTNLGLSTVYKASFCCGH